MVEWLIRLPKPGELRIRKSFCLFPTRVGKYKVWLGFIYYFEYYKDAATYAYAYPSKPHWVWEFKLTPSRYKKFKQELAVHLLSNDDNYRKYAQLILKEDE